MNMPEERSGEQPLPSELLERLQAVPASRPELEERTVRALRHSGLLATRSRPPVGRIAAGLIAATMIFGAGLSLGERRAEGRRSGHDPAARITTSAADFIEALNAASMDDEASRRAAALSFRAAAFYMLQRFPDDQIGLVFSTALNNTSPLPPALPGREERSRWF